MDGHLKALKQFLIRHVTDTANQLTGRNRLKRRTPLIYFWFSRWISHKDDRTQINIVEIIKRHGSPLRKRRSRRVDEHANDIIEIRQRKSVRRLQYGGLNLIGI